MTCWAHLEYFMQSGVVYSHILVPLTSLTMILSSQVLSSPRCCRMALTCSKASLSLEEEREEGT